MKHMNQTATRNPILEEVETPRRVKNAMQYAELARSGFWYSLSFGVGASCVFVAAVTATPWLYAVGTPFALGGGGAMLILLLGMRNEYATEYRRTEYRLPEAPEVQDKSYNVAGTAVARHRQPKRVTWANDTHTFSGKDLDLLERNVLKGDLGIRRDTSAAGWGWLDKQHAIGGITRANFGIVKNILVKNDYATEAGVWTDRGLREILEIEK